MLLFYLFYFSSPVAKGMMKTKKDKCLIASEWHTHVVCFLGLFPFFINVVALSNLSVDGFSTVLSFYVFCSVYCHKSCVVYVLEESQNTIRDPGPLPLSWSYKESDNLGVGFHSHFHGPLILWIVYYIKTVCILLKWMEKPGKKYCPINRHVLWT